MELLACRWCNHPAFDSIDNLLNCPRCWRIREVAPPPGPEPGVGYFAGLDLGQLQDHTAFCLLKKTDGEQGTEFNVVALQRFELGTGYPVIVDKVEEWMSEPPWDKAPLVVDATGVGLAVVNMLRESGARKQVRPLTITPGRNASYHDGSWHVAKLALVSTLQVLISDQRLHIAKGVPEAATLVRELKQFNTRITPAGSEVFEADWRNRAHDDCVLSIAITCWFASHGMRRLWIR